MALHGPCPTCIHLVSWLEKPYKGTSAAQRARGRTSLCTEGHFLLVSFIMKPENRSHDLSRFLTERGSSNFAIWLSFSAAAITEIGLEFKHQPEKHQKRYASSDFWYYRSRWVSLNQFLIGFSWLLCARRRLCVLWQYKWFTSEAGLLSDPRERTCSNSPKRLRKNQGSAHLQASHTGKSIPPSIVFL